MRSRRQFLASSLSLTATAALPVLPILANSLARGRAPHLLLRSSWQTVNIGDVAHTPGVLSLLQKYLPQAEVSLWPNSLGNGVDKLLLRHFPDLNIVQTPGALKAAFERCDFLLHGSGASLVAESHVVKWSRETGKPYGIYGITLPPRKSSRTDDEPSDALARTTQVLSEASFVYFRDSKSLAFAKSLGCSCPVMEFGPDGAFACDVRDADKAEAFLASHGLEPGKFLCCIPRLRYTPYWTIPARNDLWTRSNMRATKP